MVEPPMIHPISRHQILQSSLVSMNDYSFEIKLAIFKPWQNLLLPNDMNM